MRISPRQQEAIVSAAKVCFGKDAQSWLFGSRVDDSKKGGDVDIYIETDFQEGLFVRKLDFLELLFDAFGDQKIDVLIRCRSRPMTPIQVAAKETGLLL